MEKGYKILGNYIRLVDERNKDLSVTKLLGVSISKKFIPSIANIVGTDGCYSNGKFFDFKDAVQVNMLLAVPEGVTVEPAEVLDQNAPRRIRDWLIKIISIYQNRI